MLGTISAGAEEPPALIARADGAEDYLRGCGGTRRAEGPEAVELGLSPRVRRNLGICAPDIKVHGTISAGAEEPIRAPTIGNDGRDYLRGCGGTTS